MKLVDRLVLKEVVPMFFIGVAMFFSLWFAGDPILQAIRYMGMGISPVVVLKLIGWMIPPVLALTFPMGMLLAVLLGFGRLSGDSEAVALFAGGIPFTRVVMPAIIFACFASVIGFALTDQVASAANKRLGEIRANLPGNLGETTKPFDFHENYKDGNLRFLVHIQKGFDLARKELREVTIVQFRQDGRTPSVIFTAERASWRQGKSWRLFNTKVQMVESPFTSDASQDDVPVAISYSPEEVALVQHDPNELTVREISTMIRQLKAGGHGKSGSVRLAEIGFWHKLALPLATLVFAILGAPLGLRPQRTSKFTGWILAVLIIFAYYVLYTVMSSIARTTSIPPLLAVFMPNIIGCVIGAYLIWKRSQV